MANALANAHEVKEYLELSCALCKKDLIKPKLLPCQHSFCTQCLVQLHVDVDDRPFCCPTCQTEIELDNDTIESIPGNYMYDIIIEATGLLNSELRCSPCNQGKKVTNATHKCLDCGDTMCQNCSEWHCKFLVTKHHVVVALTDLQQGQFQNEILTRKVLYCDLHSTDDYKAPLSSYCDECRCLVCIACIQGDHKGHNFIKLNEKRQQRQVVFDENVLNLQKSQRDQDKRIGNVKKAMTDTKQKWNQQETEVYDTATELYALVDKIKDEKLTELKSHYEKELKYLDGLLNEENNKQKSLLATVAFTDTFLKRCADSDFLYHEDDVKTRIELCQNRLSRSFKRNLAYFEKQEKDSIEQAIQDSVGSIRTRAQHFSHKCRLGKVREKFKKKTGSNHVYGLAYNPVNTEIVISTGCENANFIIFDENGHFRKKISFDNIKMAFDIAVKNSHTYLTVCNSHSREIIKIDQDGKIKNHLKLPDDDQESKSVLGLVVGDDDTIFIASSGMNRIYKWNPEEDNMSTHFSSEKGHELKDPLYICLTPVGKLVVSNKLSSNVQVYSKEGELEWQYDGKEEGHELKNPEGICCDKDGYIYVIDKGNARIHVLFGDKLVGVIPMNHGFEYCAFVPLVVTPDGDLIYGYNTNVVRISFWE